MSIINQFKKKGRKCHLMTICSQLYTQIYTNRSCGSTSYNPSVTCHCPRITLEISLSGPPATFPLSPPYPSQLDFQQLLECAKLRASDMCYLHLPECPPSHAMHPSVLSLNIWCSGRSFSTPSQSHSRLAPCVLCSGQHLVLLLHDIYYN